MNNPASPFLLDEFNPPVGLRHPDTQTVLSSVLRRRVVPKRVASFLDASQEEVVNVDGMKVFTQIHDAPGPTIALIPGWLGSGDSGYVQSVGAALWTAGFRIARITLRDHGATAGMNESLFNSAMHEEVAAVVAHCIDKSAYLHGGIIGFSLGGNFALRVARELPRLTTLAVCPAIIPDATMYQIDRSVLYQKYFIKKWRKIWRDKAAAYPTYNFDEALRLSTVSAITDYFVKNFTPFASTDEYFSAYDLSGSALAGVRGRVLTSQDDPIIPISHFQDLPTNIELHVTEAGGHGAYIENWRMESWLDRYAVHFFQNKFSHAGPSNASTKAQIQSK